jgi:hypothetical protein
MAKIEKFQALEAWKMARKITNEIYSLSRQENLVVILLFAIRFVGRQFQFCRTLPKVLKEMAIKSFCSFYRLQRLLVPKFKLNFMLR